jgi:hypothetical protein
MFSVPRLRRDPFEGTAAYRTRIRVQLEGAIALTLAVAACGLTGAMWLRVLGPVLEQAILG